MATSDSYAISTDNTGLAILTIPVGATSALQPFNCLGTPPLGFRTPVGWTACTVLFTAMEPNNFVPNNAQVARVYDETDTGVQYQIVTQADDGYYRLPPTLFNAVGWINFRCSTPQLNTDKNVSLILAPVWQGIHK